jgi:hypothetical protein
MLGCTEVCWCVRRGGVGWCAGVRGRCGPRSWMKKGARVIRPCDENTAFRRWHGRGQVDRRGRKDRRWERRSDDVVRDRCVWKTNVGARRLTDPESDRQWIAVGRERSTGQIGRLMWRWRKGCAMCGSSLNAWFFGWVGTRSMCIPARRWWRMRRTIRSNSTTPR